MPTTGIHSMTATDYVTRARSSYAGLLSVVSEERMKVTVEDTTLDVNVKTATKIKTGTSLDVNVGNSVGAIIISIMII